MKNLIKSLSILGTTGLTMAILLGNRPASALTFVFSQSGWGSSNATVTGTFSGEDTNGNGIRFDENKVSAYEMTVLAGNSRLIDFTHNLDNLDNLVYNLSGNTNNDIIVSLGTSNYTSKGFLDRGVISQGGTSIITSEPASVREVSEPRSWIGLVLFGFGAYFKRKISTEFFD